MLETNFWQLTETWVLRIPSNPLFIYTIFYVLKIPHKYFFLERGGVVKEKEEFKEHFS